MFAGQDLLSSLAERCQFQRQAFKVDCPDFLETLLGGSFREFNVAMIAGISIIIDPVRSTRDVDLRY